MTCKRTQLYFIALIFLFAHCKSDREAQNPDFNAELYKDYINGYSSGLLKRSEPVRVEFTKPVVNTSEVGNQVPSSIYKVIPEIAGKCIWKNTQLLEFYPDKSAIKSTVAYRLELNLQALFPQIEKSLQNPQFEFNYLPVELSIDVMFPRPDADGSQTMYVTGNILVNDIVDLELIKKSIIVNDHAQKNIPIEIQASPLNPNTFEMFIGPVPRQQKSTEIKLKWQKYLDQKGSSFETRTIRVPAMDEFSVMGIDESRISQRNLTIYFSNLLQKNQNIRGLVTLKNDTSVLQLVKESDHILVRLPENWNSSSGSLVVSKLIKSESEKQLEVDHEYIFSMIQNPPQVRFVQQGKILPYTKDVILPFEAINLHTVHVELFKTFANNVLYNIHLGFDSEFGSYDLHRLGRVIKQKRIKLDDLSPGSNAKQWKRYGLNLNEFIEAEPGANYQVRISFKPEDSDYECPGGKPQIPEDYYYEESGNPDIKSVWREYAYYNYSDYGSNDTEDPCNISYYYKDHYAKISFFASNIAMIAKTSEQEGQTMVVVYDVVDGTPVHSSIVNFYDNQLQLISSQKSDGNGIVKCQLQHQPAYIQAIKGKHYSYLKIVDNKSISLSEFDVSGIRLHDGLKASIYTERGVRRPGDSIFINVIIHQSDKRLPDKLPLEFSLINPKRQVVYKTVNSENLQGLYSFQIPTKETDITGVYIARIQSGLSVFEKRILIETIKPNRYKVNWPELENDKGLKTIISSKLLAAWLHGAPANSAKALVGLQYKLIAPDFKKFEKYSFLDPENNKMEGELEIFNGSLNEHGEAQVFFPDLRNVVKTGMLKISLVTKITGNDGDVSSDFYETKKSVFNEFVGLKIPEGPYGRQLEVGKDQEIQLVVLNEKEQFVPDRDIKIDLFQVSYDWWYEMRSSYRGDFQRSHLKRPLLSKIVRTDRNGKAQLKIRLDEYDLYYIKATNTVNSYSSGEYFYTGWSHDQNHKEFVNILSFKSDKERYNSGDRVSIDLPGASRGMYLINLIKADKIIKTDYLKPSATRSAYHFDVTNEMIPNVYVDITYVQGREKKNNDLPLRLYGVIPVYVEDKNIKLLPRIVMPNQIKPNENFSIEVSEELSREMAYQIFIVDEGLLNLTRFKTPDPYNDIMSKEALTILSYDNFNDVIGHMDGELEKVFSVGGDLAVNTNQLVKNKRFTPVVMRTEASLLKKGERKKHVFNIANYIGAVRVMVIANSYGKFGSTDKTVEVKKDLMTQVAFPRVMSCNDEVLVPVTVFSANPAIKEVSVRIDCKGEIKLVDDRIKKINFTRPGDQTIYFKVKGNNKIGNAEVNIQANSGSELATSSVSFFVDNLNPISHSVHNYWIEPGKTLREVITPYGMDGTRKVQLEVSGFQGLSVDKLKSELMQYPHGCLEQIVSAAFPQLYLAGLMNADAKQGELIYKHVQSAIEKLRRYQSLHGVFLYWPGGDQLSEWAHSYAGHFLIESRNSGFNVPTDILQNWYKAQRTLSNTYRSDKAVKNYHRPQVFQAYRLFTLALYGQAEWSAMNALYQEKSTDFLTRVLLSGAYTLAGKNEIAEKLLSGSIPELPAYRENSFSFGSDVRDEAMMVMVLTLQNKNNEASKLLGKLLKRTSGNYRLSTQEMAMILMSAGKLYGNTRNVKLKFNHTWNGSLKTIESDYPVYITELKPDAKQYLEFTNHSAIPVSVSLLQSGKETINQQMDISKGITLNLEFNTANTNKSNLTSGDPVNTIITIHNTGQTGRIDNIALTAVFPAGLELDNRRIGGLESHNAKLDYEDYRDDRICYYFGLNAGESLRINVPLTSSYPGKFGPPVFICEAMYDPGVYAKKSLAPLQIFTRK